MAGPSKSKPDPRAWIPTPEILDKVRQQAQAGITEANIARNVGLHPSTFSEKKQKYPELAEALKVGHAVGEELAVGALWRAIQNPECKGHMTAVLFYLKARHGWSDGRTTTVETTAPSGVKFTVVQSGDTDAE